MDEKLKFVKGEFYRFRNGIVADTLRKAGMPYSVIFGVDVPRLAEIAKPLGKDEPLADLLWADKTVRESRLLATYLYDPATITEEKALQLACDVNTQEEADMLVFRLLKRMPHPELLDAKLTPLSVMGSEAGNDGVTRVKKALEAHLIP
jgi:hypothetical protein